MFKCFDKIILKNKNKTIEINDSEFDVKKYMGYEIIGYKYILDYNGDTITFENVDERLNYMNDILEKIKSKSLELVSQNGRYGYSNKSGELVIPYIYEYAREFHDGLAYTKKNGKRGYIDTTGNLVIPDIYEQAHNFHDGLARVHKNGKLGYIDTTGNLVIPCIYDEAYDFYDGWARIKKNGR